MLLKQLDQQPLAARGEMVLAFAGKGASARRDLVDRFTPNANAIRLPAALLTSPEDLEEYVKRVKAAVAAAGYPVSIEA